MTIVQNIVNLFLEKDENQVRLLIWGLGFISAILVVFINQGFNKRREQRKLLIEKLEDIHTLCSLITSYCSEAKDYIEKNLDDTFNGRRVESAKVDERQHFEYWNKFIVDTRRNMDALHMKICMHCKGTDVHKLYFNAARADSFAMFLKTPDLPQRIDYDVFKPEYELYKLMNSIQEACVKKARKSI